MEQEELNIKTWELCIKMRARDIMQHKMNNEQNPSYREDYIKLSKELDENMKRLTKEEKKK